MKEETISIDGRKFALMGLSTGDGDVLLSCDSEVWWKGELHELRKAIEESGKANTICCDMADIPFVKALFSERAHD